MRGGIVHDVYREIADALKNIKCVALKRRRGGMSCQRRIENNARGALSKPRTRSWPFAFFAGAQW